MITCFENYERTDRAMEAIVPSQDNNSAGPAINASARANFETSLDYTELLRQLESSFKRQISLKFVYQKNIKKKTMIVSLINQYIADLKKNTG